MKNVRTEYERYLQLESNILEKVDGNGCASLHFGTLSGNVDVVNELVRLGADVNRLSTGMGGVTPLILAATKNHVEIVKALLEAGADPSIGRARDGWTPLHICAESNFSTGGQVLLEHSPLLVDCRDHKGYTFMDIARRKKSVEFIHMTATVNTWLLRRGGGGLLRSVSENKISAVSNSSGMDRPPSAPLAASPLKREKSSTEDFDPSLVQTIFDAARAGDCTALEETCRAQGEKGHLLINAQQRSGWTVLMEAAAVGRHQAVKTLIELGADLEARNKKGMTALHIAVRYGYVQTVRALLEGGASTDVVTKRGDTIEELAASHKHHTLLAFLVNRRSSRSPQSPSVAVMQDGSSSELEVEVEVNESSLELRENISTGASKTSLHVSREMSHTNSGNESEGISAPSANATWRRGNLSSWLAEVGLAQYYSTLLANGFEDLASLSVLTDEDMASLGLLLGHRRIFRAEIRKLQEHFPALFIPRSISFIPMGEEAVDSSANNTHDVSGSKTASLPPRHKTSTGPRSVSANKKKNSRKKKQAKAAKEAAALPRSPDTAETSDKTMVDTEYMPANVLRRSDGGAAWPSSLPKSSRDSHVPTGPSIESVSTSDVSMLSDLSTTGESDKVRELLDVDGGPVGMGVKRLDFNEMDIGGIVGEGSFGTVREGWWRDMHIAVKALRVSDLGIASRGEDADAKDSTTRPRSRGPAKDWTASQALLLSKAQVKELLHEAETMARVCNHSFVIQFIGIVLDPVPCVVTLFCENGSVENLIFKTPASALPDYDTLLRFALETAIGVKHLHMEGIIHRDLATRNLLIDENFHIRVADFGFARVKDAAASKGYTNSTMGPVRWSAPEAMRRRRYSESSDVFSFGVVLYEMFAQSYPWPGYDTLDVAVRVCGGERMDIPPDVPLDIADLMILCWSHEESLRPTLNEVIDTVKFLREDAAMVEKENRELQWMLKGASDIDGGGVNEVMEGVDDTECFCTAEDFFLGVESTGGGESRETRHPETSPSSYGVTHKVLFQS